MMVRTIQHPGVQIQESEIGGYTSTVVMNNAYIMGFTDRGPIYDYSWITTTKEFTKIYGEPQTEAEKYLFIAVQSVLQNGGTPIVARMPYDNKQCKAYKALKMTWADITPDIDTDLKSPLVPLQDVADRININKSFQEIFTTQSVMINGSLATEDDLKKITVAQIAEQLNPYKSGSEVANGVLYEDFIQGLMINGVYPSGLGIDQLAVSSMVESLFNDASKCRRTWYRYDEGENNAINPDLAVITGGFIPEPINFNYFHPVYDKYIKVTYNDVDEDGKSFENVAMISVFNVAPENGLVSGWECYNASDIPEKIANVINEMYAKYKSGAASDSPFASGPDALTSKKNPTNYRGVHEFVLTSTNYKLIDFAVEADIDSDGKSYEYVTGDKVAYVMLLSDFTEHPTFTLEYDFIVRPKLKPVDEQKYYYIYQGDKSFVDISDYVNFCVEDGKINSEIFKAFFGSDTPTSGEIFGSARDSTPHHKDVPLDTLYPLFTNTTNGILLNADGTSTNKLVTPENIEAAESKLVAFYNGDIESPAISGILTLAEAKTIIRTSKDVIAAFNGDTQRINDFITTIFAGATNDTVYPVYSFVEFKNKQNPTVYPPETNTQTDVKRYRLYDPEILAGPTKCNPLNFTDFVCSGTVNVKDYSVTVLFETTLADVPVTEITDDIIFENEPLVWLRTIYNNPYFVRIDEDVYMELEASMLTTPEMGFKYGLYLDSEDCEISNDQYDDLVTVNQFKQVDRTIDKYGQDIDDANFIIVDKQKTVVNGVGGNLGYFTCVIDPFDALKVQRLLVNPIQEKDAKLNASSREVSSTDEDGVTQTRTFKFDHSTANNTRLDYWAYESANAWNLIYEDLLDSMDCLQRVRNADGIYIGEPNPKKDEKPNIMDSWSVPLTGGYYEDSISKTLMRKFPGIPLASVSVEDLKDPDYKPSIIDHNYATHIMVAVCKTTIDQTNGKIIVNLVETFFGSLFNEKNLQNGRSLFIGDIINANSEYIEFYRNDYVSAGEAGAYDPPEYRRTDVNQIFIKDSDELKNAAQLRGIDYEDYGCDALDPAVKAANEAEYYKDLADRHIYAIDKKEVCIYNLHWEANLTSFSKKESQKVIANTSGLYSVTDGTTINIAKNFLVDMDRCIKFIKNIDEIPLHFICDAGLSTIAQFCDNVVWNPNKKSVVGEEVNPMTGKKTGVKIYEKTGGWITQPFDPDNDPDGEDRYITGYEDVATWRRVVEKIVSIAGEIRKDCFAIIDAPRQLTLDGAAPKIRRSKFTNNFDKTIGRCMRYISGINSSYVAGYYNWLRTTDQYSGKSIWIPPTSKIIGNYCYLNINNLPWLAPAGLTYGLISGCHAVSHNPDYQEEDQIYMKSWNYIKQYPMEGLVVEGQRTLLGKESAFERVNVRLLFLDLERFAYNVSRTFKYQVNNTYTREQFVQTLKPKFEDYTLRGGIYEYLIRCDNTNNTPETIDANELRGDIFIKPARLIEFILLNFCATSTATDFTELQLG